MTSAFDTYGVDSFSTVSDSTALGPNIISVLLNEHSDAIESMETALTGYGIYAPTPNGNGLTTVTSTWAGLYQRVGYTGRLLLAGEVKGNWAGSGFLSIPLPSGWTATAIESVGTCWGNPMPNPFGVHWTGTTVCHASSTEVRFIAKKTQTVTAAQGFPGYCSATAATDVFACGTAHGLTTGDQVTIAAANSTAAPAGTTIGATYYVIASGLTSTAFKLSTSSGGSTINVTADGNVLVNKQSVYSCLSSVELALDGVNSPATAPFTGDGTSPNDDMMYASIVIQLA